MSGAVGPGLLTLAWCAFSIPHDSQSMQEVPEKRIIAAFPPNRHSAELKRVVDGYMFIGDDKIRRAQLPREVVTEAGVVLRRPKHWA